MYQDLAGKTAVVTGGSKGIGYAIAVRFGKEKMNVVINYHTDPKGAANAAADVIKAGGQAVTVQADISTEAGAQSLLQAALDNFGDMDVWINNAGMETKTPTHQLSLAEWNRVIGVDETGVFLGAKTALAYFKAQKKAGNIINMSSVHERIPWPTFASYATAKGGVKLFTETTAMEYAPDNIRINAIGPGAINTPINAEKFADPAQYDATVNMIPMGRIGKPEEVAAAAAWLASSESSYVSGVTLFVDGGMTLYPAFKDGRG